MILIYYWISGYEGAVLTIYTKIFGMIAESMIAAEMVILKILYIKIWNKMAMLDDNFLATVLFQLNIFVPAFSVFTRVYLGEPRNNFHIYFLAEGEQPWDPLYFKISDWYKIMILW